MIQSAMMFALGFFVCGLFGLMFLSAFARRTRRVAEQRLLKRLSSHRGEFDAEIAAMRAQHAVAVRRLERDAGAMRDMATAYRLESDLKDHEVITARSDLAAKEIEVGEINLRLQDLQNEHLSIERQMAEQGSALRSARRALEIELDKRGRVQEAFDRALGMVDGRLIEIRALRAESDHLRDIAESLRPGSTRGVSQVVPMDVEDQSLSALTADIEPGFSRSADISADELIAQQVVTLNNPQAGTRTEPVFGGDMAPSVDPAASNGQGIDAIQSAAEEIRRMTGEVQGRLTPSDATPVLGNGVVPVPAIEPEVNNTAPTVSIDAEQPLSGVKSGNGATPVKKAKRDTRRKLARRGLKAREPRLDGGVTDSGGRPDEQSPDARFQDAVKEIRALGQSASGRRAPGE